MTDPLTELNRIQQQMLQQHLPDNRLFDKEVLKDFGYIAGSTPYIFMLQDMHCLHPAYICNSLYTLLGYGDDEHNLSFEEHLLQDGWLSRYAEYCDFYKAMRGDEFSTTFPLHTCNGQQLNLLMHSLRLSSYRRSNAVLSILIPYTILWDKEDVRGRYTSTVNEKDKLFFEGYEKLEKENKVIVQCLYEGKSYEETGKVIFKTKYAIKARKPQIFKQLGVSNRTELVCLYNDMRKFKNRA